MKRWYKVIVKTGFRTLVFVLNLNMIGVCFKFQSTKSDLTA